jgi:hypothetical protein
MHKTSLESGSNCTSHRWFTAALNNTRYTATMQSYVWLATSKLFNGAKELMKSSLDTSSIRWLEIMDVSDIILMEQHLMYQILMTGRAMVPETSVIYTKWHIFHFISFSRSEELHRCNIVTVHSLLTVYSPVWRQLNRYSDRLRAGRPKDRSSSSGRGKIFLHSTSSRPVLWPTQPSIQWVPGLLPRR